VEETGRTSIFINIRVNIKYTTAIKHHISQLPVSHPITRLPNNPSTITYTNTTKLLPHKSKNHTTNSIIIMPALRISPASAKRTFSIITRARAMVRSFEPHVHSIMPAAGPQAAAKPDYARLFTHVAKPAAM